MHYTYPQGKHLALTFSYDDGQIHDRRLVALFNKYGLKGTFHLNSGRLGEFQRGKTFVTAEEVESLYQGHEVACHGVDHKDPLLLSVQELLLEYGEDRRALEKMTGKMVQGLSYAYGRYSETVKGVARTVGLKYSRTVKSTHDFMVPADFMEWNPTCHHGDPRLMELAESFLNSPPHRIMPLFYVWGHSYEFDRDGTWERMEEFCRNVQGRDNVWYATNLEIRDYVNALRSLEFSMDGKTIFNPSATTVWMREGDAVFSCRPGETLQP